MIACLHNKANIVKTILDYEKINVNEKYITDETPLHVASESGYTKIVEILLSHPKIDVNAKNIYNKTPKDLAFEQNNYDIVKLLEEHEKTLLTK